MGQAKSARVASAQQRARELLAAEAAEAEARRKRVEQAVAGVWQAIEARDARLARRDVQVEKLRATFEAGCAKAEAAYQEEAAKLAERWHGHVRQLLADGKSPADIATLTGLTAAEVRAAKSGDSPAVSPSRPEREPLTPAGSSEGDAA